MRTSAQKYASIQLVKPTEEGKAFIEALLRPFIAMEAEAMAVLNEEEQKKLLSLTQAYHRRLKMLFEERAYKK